MLFQGTQMRVNVHAKRPLRLVQGIVQLEPRQMNVCLRRNQRPQFQDVGPKVVSAGARCKNRNNLPNGHRSQDVFQVH